MGNTCSRWGGGSNQTAGYLHRKRVSTNNLYIKLFIPIHTNDQIEQQLMQLRILISAGIFYESLIIVLPTLQIQKHSRAFVHIHVMVTISESPSPLYQPTVVR